MTPPAHSGTGLAVIPTSTNPKRRRSGPGPPPSSAWTCHSSWLTTQAPAPQIICCSSGTCRCHCHRHHRNAGIARSLNEGLRLASEQGATGCSLSTRTPPSLLTTSSDCSPLPTPAEDGRADRVGAVAAGGIATPAAPSTTRDDEPGVTTTEEVIQTGTLWAVDALLTLGGFDESLGIDAVDAAACLALRSAGLPRRAGSRAWRSSTGSAGPAGTGAGPRRTGLGPQSRAAHTPSSATDCGCSPGVRPVPHPCLPHDSPRDREHGPGRDDRGQPVGQGQGSRSRPASTSQAVASPP